MRYLSPEFYDTMVLGINTSSGSIGMAQSIHYCNVKYVSFAGKALHEQLRLCGQGSICFFSPSDNMLINLVDIRHPILRSVVEKSQPFPEHSHARLPDLRTTPVYSHPFRALYIAHQMELRIGFEQYEKRAKRPRNSHRKAWFSTCNGPA